MDFHRLNITFASIISISALLWLWAVFTTRIEELSLSIFSLSERLPITFWTGYALLILATIMWFLSSQTRKIHFVLLLLWNMYLFIGPELVEVNARMSDTWIHLYGLKYLESGIFSAWGYASWPGYWYLCVILKEILPVNYHHLPLVLSTFIRLLQAVALLAFTNAIFSERRDVLLASLISTALFWVPWNPSPIAVSNILLALYLVIALNRGTFTCSRYITLFLFFVSTVITHGFSSLMEIAFIVLLFALSRLAKMNFRLVANPKVLIVFIIIFIGWFLYEATWAVRFQITLLLAPSDNPLLSPTKGAISRHFIMNLTPLRLPVIVLTFLFLGVLCVWFMAIVCRRGFWRKLSVERILPILFLVPLSMIPLTGSYSYEGLQRIYLYAIPFLAWFFVKEGRDRKRLALYFLIIILILSFQVRYDAEYIAIPRTAEFRGTQFAYDYLYPLSPTFFAAAGGAYLGGMTGVLPHRHMWEIWHLETAEVTMDDIAFIIRDITISKNYILYYFGESRYQYLLSTLFNESRQDVIYFNGAFTIYANPAFK